MLRAPAAGQGSPTLRPLGESVGQVMCGFLQPTTEPQRGARGVAWTHGLWRSLTDPVQSTRAQVALQQVLDQCPSGWKVLGRAEHFPIPGALKGAEPPGEPASPWSPRMRRGPEGYTTRQPLLVSGGGPPPSWTPCVTLRLVVAPLRGRGQSPVLPFACCVGLLLSVGRCGRCSCWCCFRVRGAQ